MAAEKPPILLVHGAFENDQVWGHVAGKLQADGYQVAAVNLPGRPGNAATPDNVSLGLYGDTVVAALAKLNRPAVVVGHSFGGIVIADAAEKAPAKVRTLVFTAAYLPHDGDSLVSLAMQDADAKVGSRLQIKKEQGIASIEYSARADLFANGGPEDLRRAIPDLILDEPLAPAQAGECRQILETLKGQPPSGCKLQILTLANEPRSDNSQVGFGPGIRTASA